MCDRIKVILKSLVTEKNSLMSIWKIIYTAIGYISSVFTFAVLIKDMMSIDAFELLCKKFWWALILIGFLASLVHNHEKTVYKRTMRDNDLQIEVKVADLFSSNALSYVIPTNTYFRTIMKDDYISSESVQGAFQLKYFKDNFQELDRMIFASLSQQKIKGQEESDIWGDVMKYPLGTVAKVDFDKKHFYFVAINDVNQYGKPVNQAYNNVETAFDGLFKAINSIGHYDDLAMPLIGTGKAAIREATIENVVEDTINRFVCADDKIARKLIICIRPKDYLEGRADFSKIVKYLDYKSEFV